MLASPFATGVAHSILDKIGRGEDVVIHFSDQSAVAISTQQEALRLLREQFGWVEGSEKDGSNPPLLEDVTAARVLEICRRMPAGFTLKEIVSRVLDEKPEIILEFANAWGRLVRNRRIRVIENREPCLYALA